MKTFEMKQLKEWMKGSSDIVCSNKFYEDIPYPRRLELFYCPNLVDMIFLNHTLLPRIEEIMKREGGLGIGKLKSVLEIKAFEEKENAKQEWEEKLFSGFLFLYDDSTGDLFYLPMAKIPKRSPEESALEQSVRGPRDGLVENLYDNMALIRQRLKTTSLKSIEYTLGERSRTKILLLYLDDVLNPGILREVQKRMESFSVDLLVSSNQLEEMLYDNPYSIFPLMDNIGRPDFVAQALNQGRFALLVDGSPTCLIGPTHILQLTYSPTDSNSAYFSVSLVRILRILALFTTIFLPGLYIALVRFNPEQIPLKMLATLLVSRHGLPLPPPLEAIIMVFLFELFKEAGMRLPKAVGSTVSVLGALIIGNAAIQSGLTSPLMLVVVSVSVISGFTLVNQNIAGNVIILRIFVLIVASFLGVYGFFLSFFLVGTFVASLESFGYSYVSFLAHPNFSDLPKTILKFPFLLLKKRSFSFQPTDTTRKKRDES